MSGQIQAVAATTPMLSTLTDTQLAERIGLGLTVFYERKNAGHFAFLELKPQLPNSNTRYSGALVSRWLDGEDLTVASSRRFFGTASSAKVLPMPARRGRRPGRPRKSVSLGAAVHASTVATAVEVDESTVRVSIGGGR